MKKFLILFPLFALASDIVDLGVIGDRSVIQLEKCRRRTDFAAFEVQVVRRGTNKVEFTTTNDFLTLTNLAAVSEGRSVLAVRQLCGDGSASDWSLFRINIQRQPASAPKARVATFIRSYSEPGVEQLIEDATPRTAMAPPMPTLPLPRGTNWTYPTRRNQ